MDYQLTDEQESFRKLFHSFAQKEVAPRAEEADHEEHLAPALLAKAAEQGMLAATVPEDLGGAALDPVTYCLMLEELGQACLSTAVTIATHNSQGALPIVLAGTGEQKEQWLPALAGGEMLGALAATEPEAGSDLAAMQTRAVLDGDEVVLDGVKSWVSNGGDAGLFIVVALTAPEQGWGGMTAYLVPRDAPGLEVGAREPTLGMRGLTLHTLYLDGCRVPAANRLGEENGAWPLVARAFDHMRLALAACSLGAAEGALALGKQFAVERKQFGVSIARKQAVSNYFADTRVEIESLRHLVLYAAHKAAAGQEYALDATMAKLLGAQTARNAANRMLQVHGGYGFSDEYPISRVYRDVRALALIGGTDQLQRVLIAQGEFAGTGVEINP